mgnify:CR=1 FL=1
MKMKLSLAAALAHHPKLLILDEATAGLDPVVRDEILDEFLNFIQDEEHSILISSHITSDLEKVADYITYLHQGRVVLSEAKDVIQDNYGAWPAPPSSSPPSSLKIWSGCGRVPMAARPGERTGPFSAKNTPS